MRIFTSLLESSNDSTLCKCLTKQPTRRHDKQNSPPLGMIFLPQYLYQSEFITQLVKPLFTRINLLFVYIGNIIPKQRARLIRETRKGTESDKRRTRAYQRGGGERALPAVRISCNKTERTETERRRGESERMREYTGGRRARASTKHRK